MSEIKTAKEFAIELEGLFVAEVVLSDIIAAVAEDRRAVVEACCRAVCMYCGGSAGTEWSVAEPPGRGLEYWSHSHPRYPLRAKGRCRASAIRAALAPLLETVEPSK